jgi:hypothetical protein
MDSSDHLAPSLLRDEDRPARLTRYETARAAVAEARRVDEVKEIVDRWAAVQEYARRANDTQLLNDATELRFDAERKGGELLIEMAAKGERDPGHGDRQSEKAKSQPVTQLADLKITKTQSSRWQQLAKLNTRVRFPSPAPIYQWLSM